MDPWLLRIPRRLHPPANFCSLFSHAAIARLHPAYAQLGSVMTRMPIPEPTATFPCHILRYAHARAGSLLDIFVEAGWGTGKWVGERAIAPLCGAHVLCASARAAQGVAETYHRTTETPWPHNLPHAFHRHDNTQEDVHTQAQIQRGSRQQRSALTLAPDWTSLRCSC